MSDNPKLSIEVSMDFEIDCDLDVEAFHDRAMLLMDELHAIEQTDPDVSDATVGSDAGKHIITVDLLIFGHSHPDCLQKALDVIRTAAHASGGHTGNWPRVVVDNPAETRMTQTRVLVS